MQPTAVPATLLVGNPRAGSRTFAVAEQLTGHLRSALDAEGVPVAVPDVVDLAEFGALLPARMSGSVPLDTEIAHAIRLVCRPGLLVVVSPTFKGSYPGLMKLFFDMFPIGGLAGCVAVPAMTAGWSHHRTAGDQYLRPLLVELGASSPVPCLSILEEEFAELPSLVRDWAGTHAPALGAVVARRHRDRVAPAPVAAGAGRAG
jgi:FMN reductase